jgi:integrase
MKLGDIIPEYLKHRRIKQREGCVKRDYYSLKQLTDVLGYNKAVQDITYKDMEEKFIPYFQKKGYTNGGINISARTVKVFLNYLHKEKLISEKITFSMLPVDQEPCFINRAEIKALHDAVDARWRRWFTFYELTGCRASDPFKGFLEGNLWKIPPEQAKTKHWHYHRLTDELIYIWMELQDLKQSYMDKKKSENQAIDTCYQLMQKNMNRAIKKLRKDGKVSQTKKLTLKSFRHTFGIIDVTITNDIWGTSKRMNHKEIGVTQDYLDLQNYYDLGNEFPELKPYLVDKKSILQGKVTPDSDIPPSPLHTPKLGDVGHVLMDTRG